MADHREGGKQGVLKQLSINLCAFTEKERKTTDRRQHLGEFSFNRPISEEVTVKD